MTQQDIIDMAIKAELNLYVHDLTEKQYIQVIEAFAKLVDATATAKATEEANARANSSWTLMCKKMVEEEREACALICDDLYRAWTLTDEDDLNPPDALDCKRAIRARGES